MSNTFGTLFRVTTFGESHGKGIGAVIDGCPPRVALSEADIQAQLDRRRPGQSLLTTSRSEKDEVSILSGVQDGVTLGTPVGLFVANRDQRPGDYDKMRNVPRPSHADFTYQE
ncbi:MAG: chorismate synthase, partial [Candidatus Pacebacteria bacterium]|nr:chorismate synthase [Candidatus Paceibacterota bacterium]